MTQELKTCFDCRRKPCKPGRFLCDECWEVYQFVTDFEVQYPLKGARRETPKAS